MFKKTIELKTFEQILSVTISGIIIVYMIINFLMKLKFTFGIIRQASGKTVLRIRTIINSLSNDNYLKTIPLQLLLAAEAMLWLPVAVSAFYTYNIGINIALFAFGNSILLSALILTNRQGLFASISAARLVDLINIIQLKLSSILTHAKK